VAGEGREDTMVEGAAGVQNDFGAKFIATEFCKFLRRVSEHVIGNGQQDYIGIECFRRERGVRRSGTDGADCSVCAGARAGDNCADSPAEFAEALRESLTDTTGADDGNCARRFA
jgi:hypothetical protein